MFGSLGGPEIILIFIVALIVFGPKQLPEIGRKVGGLVREFRRATGEFRVNLEREIGFDPLDGLEATKKARRDLLTSVTEPIREVTEGTIVTVREARKEATAALTVARSAGAGPAAAQPPGEAGAKSEPGPAAPRQAEGRGELSEAAVPDPAAAETSSTEGGDTVDGPGSGKG